MKDKIAIAADHGGFELKQFLISSLENAGYEIVDLGADKYESADDFPDYAAKMAAAIQAGEVEKGVLICGTGIGMSMAANRHPHIRAALVHDGFTARTCREHNDANVLVLGGRILGPELALDCAKIFLATEFLGGKYQCRNDKMNESC